MVKGIADLLMMIPKGGKFASSVVNMVYKAPKNWEKFTTAVQQIERILKKGKLRLDGKQKTIFETNKNILKNYEKVTKGAKTQYDKAVKDKKDFINKSPQILDDLFKKKEFPPFNVSKEDFTKGWTPTLIERSNLRNVYKKLDPPERLYTKEMEAIDEELNELMLYSEGKYSHLSVDQKAALFKKLQAEMQKLIKVAMKNDLSTLSLSQINKKSHDLQKRIREIANNPNIKGDVHEGPKRDMIKILADSERPGLTKARHDLIRKNSELKYGKKYPVLDPDNNAFIIYGLDEAGNPMKVDRFRGRFSAIQDTKTGDVTRKEGTSYWDTWDPKKNQIRKEGEEVFHQTVDSEGKVIMSNPDYILPKTENMDIWRKLYDDEISISELSKKGFKLKDIDMLVKGREARKYLEKTKHKDHNIATHEQTSYTEIGDVMEDLYHRGDDIYKMSMKEWVTKIPEYFAGGGHVPGFATGGVSNLFRQRQGFRAGTAIELVKGARWLIRMLKEMSDDMIYGQKQFANMAEALKMKY